MAKFLIFFDEGSMEVADEDMEEVTREAHAVDRAAREAGVRIFAGGLMDAPATIVDAAGAITQGADRETKARVGGLMIIDVASRHEALDWARRLALACRCPQEVREFLYDPISAEW